MRRNIAHLATIFALVTSAIGASLAWANDDPSIFWHEQEDGFELITPHYAYIDGKYAFILRPEKGAAFCTYRAYSLGQGGVLFFTPFPSCRKPFTKPYAIIVGRFNMTAMHLPDEKYATINQFGADVCGPRRYKISDITFANLKGFECSYIDKNGNRVTEFGFLRNERDNPSTTYSVWLYTPPGPQGKIRQMLKRHLANVTLWGPY